MFAAVVASTLWNAVLADTFCLNVAKTPLRCPCPDCYLCSTSFSCDWACAHLRRWGAFDGGQLNNDDDKIGYSKGYLPLHLRQGGERFQPAQALGVRGVGAELRLSLSRTSRQDTLKLHCDRDHKDFTLTWLMLLYAFFKVHRKRRLFLIESNWFFTYCLCCTDLTRICFFPPSYWQ